jgi:hypothetical protein
MNKVNLMIKKLSFCLRYAFFIIQIFTFAIAWFIDDFVKKKLNACGSLSANVVGGLNDDTRILGKIKELHYFKI